VAKASMIIGDPSYFSAGKTRVTGKVARSICILDHPIIGNLLKLKTNYPFSIAYF
jgi:hypothetical protein